jgi:surfeit locus 1 family protein
MPPNQIHVRERQTGQNGSENKKDPITHGSDYRLRTTLQQRSRHLLKFWTITLAAVVSIGATLALGNWQLSRAKQKEDLQQRLLDQRAQPPMVLADALQQGPLVPGVPDELLDREIKLKGRWLDEWTVLLDNRPMNGKQGFLVLTPLQDVNSGQVVLVQRGWVQRDFNDRTRIPPFVTPKDQVVLAGRVVRAPSQTLVLSEPSSSKGLATAQPPSRIRQNLKLNDLKEETHLALWDRTVLQTDPAGDGLLRDWPAPNLGVEKHHGYAFQWFGLCALIAALYVWFQLVPRFRSHVASN